MKIEITGETMIFAKEWNDKILYSTTVGKKVNGEWENAYINVNFRNGVKVEHKTKINIKQAWLSFYKKDDKATFYIFVNDFDTVGEPEIAGFTAMDEACPF
jgi:hypothetical protein